MPWTTAAQIATALGPSVTVDPPWADMCAAAADAWARRKRLEAGYDDTASGDNPPSADVGLGTTMYGVALYRERGAVDGYPSFEDLSSFAPTGGSFGQIRRLLGIGRGRVDRPPTDDELLTRRRRRRVRVW